MPNRIEDYAAIGNCETMALVGRDGSIDWLGLPRFDSAACFAALLGEPRHGRWLIAPDAVRSTVSRTYRGDSMILETTFATDAGRAVVIDFMSRRDGTSDLVRIVRGIKGRMAMHTDLVVRFGYGSVVPWVSRAEDGRLELIAGPDRLLLDTRVALRGADLSTVGEFEIGAGDDDVVFTLTWSASWQPPPPRFDAVRALQETEGFWSGWLERLKDSGEWSEAIGRSLLTLKALSHHETGGIVAAGTTSLPEKIGGARNWDYRLCWLRDSTFTLYAFLGAGFLEEAQAWRQWLLRAVAGSPDELQIMYGVAGERRLVEYTVDWLPGYEASAPVRIGNAAADQVQLDVYGEVLATLYVARRAGLSGNDASWALE